MLSSVPQRFKCYRSSIIIIISTCRLPKHTQTLNLVEIIFYCQVFLEHLPQSYILRVHLHFLLVFQGLPVYANNDLSEAQKAGIVTIEMGTGDMPLVRKFMCSHRAYSM